MTLKLRRRTRQRDETGFVLVWFALVMFVLLAISALVVDILHAYSVVERVQNAADAGATAGVVNRPDDMAAVDKAREVALANAPGADPPNVTHAGLFPNQLQVSVTQKFDAYFAGLVGFNDLEVTRSALAEYDPPISMGSPANRFGEDPETCTNPTGCEKFFAQISGGLTAKPGGNAFSTRFCDDTSQAAHPGGYFNALGGSKRVDNCTNGSLNNEDYDDAQNGAQYYVIDSPSPPTVQIFDGVFVDVNRDCVDGRFNEWFIAAGSPGAARFQQGLTNYCTGDSETSWDYDNPMFGPDARLNGRPFVGDPVDYRNGVIEYEDAIIDHEIAVDTTFTIYGPDGTRHNHLDNVSAGNVCGARTYPGYPSMVRFADDFPGLDGWRQWTGVSASSCTGGGRYVLEVRTGADQEGNNRYAVRVQSGATISAVDYMAIFTNVSSQTGEFFLARVVPSSVDRTLVLSFFDIGDNTSGGANKFRIVPPNDPGAPAAFTDCAATLPTEKDGPLASPWTNNAPLWGSPGTTNVTGDCQVIGLHTSTNPVDDYNGQWVSVTVRIPASPGYTCDHTQPDGCWLKIQFDNTVNVNDTNTWTAQFTGNPVRIID